MNIFLIIIIIALVAEYFLGIVSNVLNLRALKPEPPEQLQDIYEPEQYKKSQQYTRENSRFANLTSSFSILLTLGVILFGVFNIADEFVRGFGYGKINTGLFFFGILTLAGDASNYLELFYHYTYD